MKASDFPDAAWTIETNAMGSSSECVLWTKLADNTFLILFLDRTSGDLHHCEAKAASLVSITFFSVGERPSNESYDDLASLWDDDAFMRSMGDVPF